MIIGAQAQIALQRGKPIFGPAEQDVSFPQLLGAQLGAIRAQDITPQQLLVLRPQIILALPNQPGRQVVRILQLDLASISTEQN